MLNILSDSERPVNDTYAVLRYAPCIVENPSVIPSFYRSPPAAPPLRCVVLYTLHVRIPGSLPLTDTKAALARPVVFDPCLWPIPRSLRFPSAHTRAQTDVRVIYTHVQRVLQETTDARLKSEERGE